MSPEQTQAKHRLDEARRQSHAAIRALEETPQNSPAYAQRFAAHVDAGRVLAEAIAAYRAAHPVNG